MGSVSAKGGRGGGGVRGVSFGEGFFLGGGGHFDLFALLP